MKMASLARVFQTLHRIGIRHYTTSFSKCSPSSGCELSEGSLYYPPQLNSSLFRIPSPYCYCPIQIRCYAARKGKREKMLREKKARKLSTIKKEEVSGGRRYASKAQLPTRERTSTNLDCGQPLDDVWIAKFNSRPIFKIAEVIEMHREIHHPTMLNLCDSPLYLTCELDMSLEKKNRFLDAFSGIIPLPHYFDDGKKKTVLAFCKNEADQNSALAAGADLAGGVGLVKQVQLGEVIVGEYKYVVAHPDMHTDIANIRGILKHRYPTVAKGSLGMDMHSLTERFKKGLEYNAEKDSVQHDFGWVEVPVGPLSMATEQLEANIATVLQAVCTHRNARLGPFIAIALLTCPPSREKIAIDISKYTPSVPQQQVGGEDDDDDETATAIKQ